MGRFITLISYYEIRIDIILTLQMGEKRDSENLSILVKDTRGQT